MIENEKFNSFMSSVGRDTALHILDLFIEELLEYDKSLNQNKDPENVRNITHKIKCTAQSVGADKLCFAAKNLELDAKNRHSDLTNRTIEMQKIMNKSREFLIHYKKMK